MKRCPPRVTASLQTKNSHFYIVARVPDSKGTLRQKWIATGLPVAGNKRRAKQLLDEKLLELQAEYDRTHHMAGWASDDIGDIPFVDVVDRWLARKRPALAPSTIEGYQRILVRLKPYFAQLVLHPVRN